ncbi:hypothetical protein [Paraburkholderia fungorum]|uniref:hypothetical protein n=1 Tax=Paraburkholderia fungorum TaxID=134537 RepID=UPI003D6C65A1
MKQSHRLALQGIAEVFDTAGVPWRAVQGGKHLCVIVVGPNGEEHKMPLAGSPRDVGDALNLQRQQAQRLLERIGVARPRGSRGERAHRRHGPPPCRALVLSFERPDHDAGPYRDPWAVLRERAR